jgi:hypothetical protein
MLGNYSNKKHGLFKHSAIFGMVVPLAGGLSGSILVAAGEGARPGDKEDQNSR